VGRELSEVSLKVAVIGLGYVGLPLARAALSAGHDVLGFDVSSQRAKALNEGKSHIEDVSDPQVVEMLTAGFTAHSDPKVLNGVDIIAICVPTPLGSDGAPDLSFVISASGAVAENMSRGTTVILESTTYPGTTVEVLAPILESSGLVLGVDFFLAFSPERVDPGNRKFGISNTPKIVGADDPGSIERAVSFYRSFVPSVFVTKGTKEAETAKLLENTYRQVNIALVNEFAKLCNSLDIDVWDVIRAASTKPFGFQPFFPGIGVGGHCIPIDPSYLAYKLKEEKGEDFEFISLAQRLSSEMPGYVAKRVRDAYLKESNEKNIKGSKIVVFGVSYKPNSSDIRETPANDLISALTGYGFSVYFVDPNVESFEVDGTKIPKLELSDLLDNTFDVIVVAQAHEEFIQGNKVFWPNVKSLVFDATGKIELEGSRIVRL